MESTELQSACVSLGFRERSGYSLEPDCLSTVKLLIRFLRNEPDGYSVRMQLGFARIFQNDLIPIMQYHSSNRDLCDAVLRLLLNLSQPTLVCFNGKLPTDKPTRKIFMELDSYLCQYKQAIATNVEFLKVMTASIVKLVKSEHDGKIREEERLVLERYLLLIRNILHIDDAKFKESGLAGEDLSGPGIHDELLLAMSKSGLDRILLYLASSAEEHGFALHVLEILWLLFRDITPSLLIAASKKDGSAALKLNLDDLQEIKRSSIGSGSGKLTGPYRAELKGTFAVKNKWLNPTSNSSNPFATDIPKPESNMVIHKHKGANDAASVLDVINQSNRRAKKSSQRDIAMQDTLEKDRSDAIATVRPALRDFLSAFAKRLLVDASGYNNLMAAADRVITHSPSDSHDESFYLWAIAFFMELARGLIEPEKFHASKAVECIGQTLGIEALTFVYTHMSTYADGLETDRFDKQMWNKRLVLAVRAFCEQIAWADTLARCKDDPNSAELGRTLVFNIVYEPQFRDILSQLLRRYKESRHCRAYLRALVAATHNHLKLTDFLLQSGCETVVVAHKSKARKSAKKSAKKTKKSKKEKPDFVKPPWADVVPGLREALGLANAYKPDEPLDDPEAEPPGFMADDPIVRGVVDRAVKSLDVEEVVRYQSTVTQIGQVLLKHEPKYAVAALRLARRLFPEQAEKYFGGRDSDFTTSEDDENWFQMLYETSELLDVDEEEEEEANEQEGKAYLDDEDDDEDDEEMVAKPSSGRETSINVSDLATKFANVHSLQPYVSLFETWQTNPTETNHHLARFFKRVAIDWQLPAMIYQLRVFQTCQTLLAAADKAAAIKASPPAQELVSFAKFAINGFFKLAATVGKCAFVEILFWKNRSDAIAFQSNYEGLHSQPATAVLDDIDAEIEAKKKKGKKGAKKDELATEKRDAAFDRLLAKQAASAAVPKDRGDSDDDVEDDDAWLKLVDKKDPNDPSKSGEASKPKKKRGPRKPKDAKKESEKASKKKALVDQFAKKDDEEEDDSKKKAKKRRAAGSANSGESNSEDRPVSSSSASSSEVVGSAKRAKLLFDDDDDDDESSSGNEKQEKSKDSSSSDESEDVSLAKVANNKPLKTYSKSTGNRKMEVDDDENDDDEGDKKSVSSLSSLELEIVDEKENEEGSSSAKPKSDNLFGDARLQLSDSEPSEDDEEVPLQVSKKKQSILAEPRYASPVETAEISRKSKGRRVIASDDEDE